MDELSTYLINRFKQFLTNLSDLSTVNLMVIGALLGLAGLLLGGTLAMWGGSAEFWSASGVLLGMALAAAGLKMPTRQVG